ncbi:serine/threonine-protein kinase pakB-like [Drosophila teissieri]|uniref:serine/threonine-protein kinase pakB-like n=1 Tax=Drosophila teissieri TaxID=7243 RepID=UPI001CBA085F|nr:serine/threonine-protein kinase pakB-like [Drosophila teissieri]
MIVNMPVNGTGSASSPTSNPSTNNNNNNSSTTNQNDSSSNLPGDYNFLKRKFDDQEELTLGHDYEPIEANPWKKRHLDYDAGDLQFHLQLEQPPSNPPANAAPAQSSTSFINDLFAYDSSLLVPTAAYSHCPPSSAPLEDNGGWTGGELLELDHRYNSGLQAELGQLNATLPPTTPTSSSAQNASNHTQQSTQQNASPGQNPHQNQHFLVPQKQRILSAGRRTSSGSGSGANEATEADFEDKNLSWLLNFKFDEFPHLSPHNQVHGQALNLPEGSAPPHLPPTAMAISTSPCSSSSPSSASAASASATSTNQSLGSGMVDQRARSPKSCSNAAAMPAGGGGCNASAGASAAGGVAGVGSTKTGRKFEELVMEVTSELDGNDMIVAEHVVVEDTSSKAPKKPPFTYTELIEYALEDKGELTVSGIYQWISDRFPYYKSNDDRWKNSVRHNLSINPHFRKGVKAPQGAGHLWAISSGDSAENVLAWEHKKQRLDLFFKMESINRERIQQHQQQQQLQQHQQQHQQHSPQQQQHPAAQQQHVAQASSCMYDEAAVAAATLTQEMMQTSSGGSTEGNQQQQHHHHSHQNHHNHNHNHHHQRLLPFNDLLSDDELRKTAGQILNGIHREVEVQSVNSIISTYHDVLLDNDYLNPIHKDVVVTESVLRQQHGSNLGGGSNNQMGGNSHMGSGNSQYYITEIDPMELGIQMSHQVEPSEEEVLFSDEFNLNYFGYNPGSDIVA